jgi:hypothetical protein
MEFACAHSMLWPKSQVCSVFLQNIWHPNTKTAIQFPVVFWWADVPFWVLGILQKILGI